jgi:hypothetical protein
VEAHVKLVSQHAGHQPFVYDAVVLALNGVSNLVQAPDVLLVLFVVLNCAHYRRELGFSVELFVQQLLHIVIFDFETPHNHSHCTGTDAELDGG